MTDKVQKIREWISKAQDGLMDAQGNFECLEHEGAFHILSSLDYYIDSLQKEPASEDFDKLIAYFDSLADLNGKIDSEAAMDIARHFALILGIKKMSLRDARGQEMPGDKMPGDRSLTYTGSFKQEIRVPGDRSLTSIKNNSIINEVTR